ncbi:hypothetical protein BGZ79_007315 [Entomortierella chlamydospora]|nr:hypothetical protein BGZ79_007315 [Entomortierella chlamydospora]
MHLVLAKSQQFPTDPTQISWSIVSTVPTQQLLPFITPQSGYVDLVYIMQCVVDDNGVFTVGSVQGNVGYNNVTVASIRYDPSATLIENSNTTHGGVAGGSIGLGEWSIASDASNVLGKFRYVNVKEPINGNNTVYQIVYKSPPSKPEIVFGPLIRGNQTYVNKSIITLIYFDSISKTKNYYMMIYTMNDMTVQGVWATKSTARGEISVITVPSQTSDNQSAQSFLVLDRDGLRYASWGPSDASVEIQNLPGIVASNNLVASHSDSADSQLRECGESCNHSEVSLPTILLSALSTILVLCCLGFSIKRCLRLRAATLHVGVVEKEKMKIGNEAPGILEKGTITAEDKNPFDDPIV